MIICDILCNMQIYSCMYVSSLLCQLQQIPLQQSKMLQFCLNQPVASTSLQAFQNASFAGNQAVLAYHCNADKVSDADEEISLLPPSKLEKIMSSMNSSCLVVSAKDGSVLSKNREAQANVGYWLQKSAIC